MTFDAAATHPAQVRALLEDAARAVSNSLERAHVERLHEAAMGLVEAEHAANALFVAQVLEDQAELGRALPTQADEVPV